MTMHPIKLAGATQRRLAHSYVDAMPVGGVIRFEPEPKRSMDQNAKLWAMLGDISKQAQHNGRTYRPEVWKVLFLSALGKQPEFIMGLEGEAVPVGFRSSHMTVAQMSDLIEFICAWAAENGITFKDRGF